MFTVKNITDQLLLTAKLFGLGNISCDIIQNNCVGVSLDPLSTGDSDIGFFSRQFGNSAFVEHLCTTPSVS